MSRTQVYLDWNLPLLPAITQRLLSDAQGEFVDLSHLLVIVPTKQARRRLLETLALELAESGRGLFPPEIVTPDLLLAVAIKHEPIASEESVCAAWVSVLDQIDFDHFQALFPIAPTPSTGWKLGMAQRLTQLRTELGEAGLDINRAAEGAAEAGHEPERWRQLARLEDLYIDKLKHRDLKDPKQARRDAALNYTAPAGIQRIILAATPDPQALPLQALERATESLPLEVWIYASDDAEFDDWGRPQTNAWIHRALDFEGWGCHFTTLADPKATAAHITKLMAKQAPEAVLLGIADPNLSPTVADALQTADIPCYDPEGQRLLNGRAGRLTELLCQLAIEESTSTVRSLLQHPDITLWLGNESSQNELLRQLDRIFEKHLVPDLDGLIHFASRRSDTDALVAALKKIKEMAKALNSRTRFATTLSTTLQAIYRAQNSESQPHESIPWKDSADAIRQKLEASVTTDEHFTKLPTDYSREAFRQSLGKGKVYPDRPKEAHDLLGWLELLWNDAPYLILAGLNETIVPDSVIGDAFLPETLREVLGLRTNAQRFARDAYLLEALCRRRAIGNGRVDLLIPQTAADGTPLKPSRLLFLGGADTLLPRTRQCFQATGSVNAHISHTLPWRLSPPADIELPASLSVSALKSYLECPFRFFLRHILKLRTIDVETRELTPATFGTLFHDTVAELTTADIAHSSEADLIKKVHAIADAKIQHQFGKQLSFALRLQHEALMARLIAYAKRQIEDIQQNGSSEILNTEMPFERVINSITIKGTIDRIDRRNERLELIDYKTADKPKHPRDAHLAKVAKKAPPAHIPEEAFFDEGEKRYRWIDLQLPLYTLSQKVAGEERPKVAYFNLGNTLERSEINNWEDFTDSHLDSAENCAAAIIQQIKDGIFWPPNPDVREDYDDFAPLFPDGIENSVDPEAFMNYQFKQGVNFTE
jgi:ATP-dependent helicase/nuclease subunit B